MERRRGKTVMRRDSKERRVRGKTVKRRETVRL